MDRILFSLFDTCRPITAVPCRISGIWVRAYQLQDPAAGNRNYGCGSLPEYLGTRYLANNILFRITSKDSLLINIYNNINIIILVLPVHVFRVPVLT